MKTIAKWVAIIWSILSIIVSCFYIFVGLDLFVGMDDGFEFLGGFFRFVCLISILLLIWLAIAGPALLIYFVSGKKETTKVEIIDAPSEERRK